MTRPRVGVRGPAERRPHRRAVRLAGVTLLLSTIAMPAPAEAHSSDAEGNYLVVLDDSVTRPADVAAEHERRYGTEVRHVFRHAVTGYAAVVREEAVDAIARDPRVSLVERDQEARSFAQTLPTGISRAFAPANTGLEIDGADDVRLDVDVAVIDTGIDLDHPDLDVVASTDCVAAGSFSGCVDDAGQDDNGHGTHVAGTIAAIDNDMGVVGMAPGGRLHAVKVLTASGRGLMSDVIAGIDWVTARAETIEVANMSLGCNCTLATLDQAISTSVDRGVVHVVAAGNDDEDAANFSPANIPDVITVSALADFDGAPGGHGGPTCRIDEDDTLGNFSNWGPLVEVAAPGVCILSTSLLGTYATLSGTSMASPHVAGAAAILTSGANDPQSRADVMAVRDMVVSSGNFGWQDDSGDGIHEPLLDVGDGEMFVPNSPTRTLGTTPLPPSDNEAPVARFTHSCSGLTCNFDATGSSDADGTISSYAWDFGDGSTGSGATTTKTYDASGTYTVTVTVTDDDGASASASTELTVTSDGGNGGGTFHLMAVGRKSGGSGTVALQWSGTDLVGTVVVYRNDAPIASTEDDGSYTDFIATASGSYTYRVCEEETDRCSNQVTVF